MCAENITPHQRVTYRIKLWSIEGVADFLMELDENELAILESLEKALNRSFLFTYIEMRPLG